MSTKFWSLAAIAVLVFAGANLFTRTALGGARVDLTEDRLYTLSEGSRNIAKSLAEPIRFDYFLSREASSKIPSIKAYAERVEDILEEFARASGGKLELIRRDPEPFSEAEDEAVLAGLSAAPLSQTEKLYFGLVAENSVGEREVIPFFDNREGQDEFLEYELARLLVSLNASQQQKVGLVTSLEVMGGGVPQVPGQRPQGPWLIVDQVRDLFELEALEDGFSEVPSDIDVLWILHPKNLAPESLYAIDQYALAGGRVVAMVDAWCEAQPDPGQDMQARMNADKTSDLGGLLESWGVRMPLRKVAGDRSLAARVTVAGAGGVPEPIDYLTYLNLTDEQFSESSPITAKMSKLVFANAGFLEPVADTGMEFESLISTTEDSMEVELTKVQFFPDPAGLLRDFAPKYSELTLAARVTGKPKSAYPDGPPTSVEAPEQADAEPASAGLTEATEEFAAIIVADADFLADPFWTRADAMSQLFGTVAKIADSPDFLLNAIEGLSGSSDLMSIRARGGYDRPFDRVIALQRDAEQRFRDEEQKLEQELQEIEARIVELGQSQSDEGVLFLNEAQVEELDRAKASQVETRKKLRRVQLSLKKDIERLGTRLQILNVAGIPALVGFGALSLAAVRRSRRRRD